MALAVQVDRCQAQPAALTIGCITDMHLTRDYLATLTHLAGIIDRRDFQIDNTCVRPASKGFDKHAVPLRGHTVDNLEGK